jgi:hypothetical protein
MKIFILSDIEGAAGIIERDRAQGRRQAGGRLP